MKQANKIINNSIFNIQNLSIEE